jgi:hypothetical protein
LLELRLGAMQSVDVIGARGFLLGSIGGGVLVYLTNARPRLPSLAIFGVALTELGIARLWLNHGETTGLTAVALGTGLAVLCLDIDPLVRGGDSTKATQATAGVVLTATLASAMQLGFSRAAQITLAYWPDIPMLIASSIALGLLISSAISRGRQEAESRRPARAWIAAIVPIVLALAMSWWCSRALVHETTPLKLLAIGLATGIILYFLFRPTSAWGGALGLVLLFAAISLAYAYWAGYGVAILMVAVWCIFGAVDVMAAGRNATLLGPLAVAVIVAIHRAVTLQNSDNLSNTDITDTWNLLAFGVGAILPLATSMRPSITVETTDVPPTGAGTVTYAILRSVLILTAPTLLIAYLFATQASDALVIGAAIAIGALAAGRILEAFPVLSATLLSLFVLEVMPVITEWKEPSRHIKVEVLIAIAVVCVVLSLLPRRRQPVVEAEEA